MNHHHLGDSLDFWKGRVFQVTACTLSSVRVVPMFTDAPGAWANDDVLKIFASLLGIAPKHILLPNSKFTGKRPKGNVSPYFTEVENLLASEPSGVSLFVDPDTGIRPTETESAKHIQCREINFLARIDKVNLVIVYDQSKDNRHTENGHIREIGAKLEFPWGVLSCGQVRMLFASRVESQIDEIGQAVQEILLGLHESNWTASKQI